MPPPFDSKTMSMGSLKKAKNPAKCQLGELQDDTLYKKPIKGKYDADIPDFREWKPRESRMQKNL